MNKRAIAVNVFKLTLTLFFLKNYIWLSRKPLCDLFLKSILRDFFVS